MRCRPQCGPCIQRMGTRHINLWGSTDDTRCATCHGWLTALFGSHFAHIHLDVCHVISIITSCAYNAAFTFTFGICIDLLQTFDIPSLHCEPRNKAWRRGKAWLHTCYFVFPTRVASCCLWYMLVECQMRVVLTLFNMMIQLLYYQAWCGVKRKVSSCAEKDDVIEIDRVHKMEVHAGVWWIDMTLHFELAVDIARVLIIGSKWLVD